MVNFPENKKIILFDGVCKLCNDTVQSIIKHDKNDVFRFAPLQSDVARQIINERGIDTAELESVILIEPGVAYYHKSAAAIEIAKHLDKFSWLKYFRSVPEGLRDGIYSFVAKNRYKWYGRKENCMVPTPELERLFLK